MLRLKNIDSSRIQSNLMNAHAEAERIRNTAGLTGLSVRDPRFFPKIVSFLANYGFTIYFTDELKDFEYNGIKYGHVPALTIYNDQWKQEKGGKIYIYSGYSPKKKQELLLHEFIHIMDTHTPRWSTNYNDVSNKFAFSKRNIREIEFMTELTAMALMMPSDALQRDLFSCSYDINKIAKDYKAIETSTLIMWIILHDYFHAHYALLLLNSSGREWVYTIDEYCEAENKLDMYNTIHNVASVAYRSRQQRQPQSGESTIDNKDYYCYCFYEKNILQPLPSEVSSAELLVKCDKLIIIGWSRHIYDFIQQLEFKKSPPSPGYL